MAYDGSGVFTVLYNWATEAASPPIAISKLDTEFAGIATGLSSVYTKTASDAKYAGLSAPTFTGAVTVSTSNPLYWMIESDAAANEKKWVLQTSNGNFSINAYNDALDAVAEPIGIVRTGTTIDSITFAGTTIVLTGAATLSGNLAINTDKFTVAAASGNTVVAGTLTVGGIDCSPSAGTFTANLRATDGGASIASGTATWKKSNGVVTLLLPALNAAGTSASLYIDSLPAAIRSTTNLYLTGHGMENGVQTRCRVHVVANDDILFVTKTDGSAFASDAGADGLLSTVLTWVV